MLPPAVVVGTDLTGLTVARSLAALAVPVIGVDYERRACSGFSSSFEFVRCPPPDGERFLRFLEDLAAALPRPSALIPCGDTPVSCIASEGRHLRRMYLYELPAQQVVNNLLDKALFSRLAESNGWPVPRARPCDTLESVDEAAEEIGFPVVLKPRKKSLSFQDDSPYKAAKCPDRASLLEAYTVVRKWEPEVIIQEWVPGADSEIWFSIHFNDADLREVTHFEGRKVRQWRPECGSTSMAVGVPQELVTEHSRRILRLSGCTGFGALEYKRDSRTGRFVIMEPTVGRPDMQVGVALANGVDLVGRAYFHLIGREYPHREPRAHDVAWVLWRSDFLSALYWIRRGRLTWRDYLASLKRPRHSALFKWSDWGLVRATLGFGLLSLLLLPLKVARRAWRVLRRINGLEAKLRTRGSA